MKIGKVKFEGEQLLKQDGDAWAPVGEGVGDLAYRDALRRWKLDNGDDDPEDGTVFDVVKQDDGTYAFENGEVPEATEEVD